jgi:multiple sugar transport system substrate-binding protein
MACIYAKYLNKYGGRIPMKKIASVLVLVFLFSLISSACSSGGTTSSPTETPSSSTVEPSSNTTTEPSEAPSTPEKEPVTLRVTWWGSQTRHDLTQQAAELFTEKYPHITIEPEFSAWDGYWERLATQIAGKNLSDVFQQDYQYLKQYADNGVMLDLTPYLGNGIDVTNIEENTLQGGAVDGKVYAISLGLNSQCVVWDPELFEQAGVPEPPERWTWQEYIDTAKQLHEKLGIYGDEHFASSHYHGLNLWLRQHGYSVYGEDGKSLGYTDDQLFADYFQMDVDLTKAGVFAPVDIRDEITSVENQLIVTQKAAMLGSLGGSNQLAALMNASGRQLKLASLPMTEGEKSGQFLKPSQFFSVYSGTELTDEAILWIDFITNDLEANRILKGERGVPISSAVREDLAPTLDDAQKEIFRYIDSVSKFAHPIGLPEPPAHAELDGILKNIRYEMVSGQISTLDGAKKFRAEAERVFAAQN